MFIDPTWVLHDATVNEQDYVEVQQAYPEVSDLHSGNDLIYGLSVGYQGRQSPKGMRAYYQIGIPLVLAGADTIKADLNTSVSFAAANGSNTDIVDVYHGPSPQRSHLLVQPAMQEC